MYRLYTTNVHRISWFNPVTQELPRCVLINDAKRQGTRRSRVGVRKGCHCFSTALSLRIHIVWPSSFFIWLRSHSDPVAAFNALSWRFFFVHWRLYRASTAFLVHCQPDHEKSCSVASDGVFSNKVVDECVKSSICEYIPEPIKGRNWNSCHFVPLFPHVF